MRLLLVSFIGTVATMCSVAQAGMYQCEVNGKPYFSDRPCGNETQSVDIDYYTPDAGSSEEAIESSEAAQSKIEAYTEKRRLKRKLNTAESRLRSLRQRRDSELAALRQKKRLANNNLAGAVWEDSISQEMTAVTARYNSDIESARAEVDRLKQAMEQL